MRSRLLFFVLFVLGLATANAQKWTNSANTSWNNSSVAGIVTDASGDMYTTGNYTVSNNCVPGPDDPACVSYRTGIFISRYNSSGDLTWEKRIESQLVKAYSITSGDKAIYVMGIYGTPNTQDISFDNVQLKKDKDVEFALFLTKYTLDGKAVWAKQLPGINGSSIRFHEGALYLSGHVGIEYNAADPYRNGFLAKLTANGELVWSKEVSQNKPGQLTAAKNRIYISIPGSANENDLVYQFDAQGNKIWTAQLTGRIQDLSADETGNCFVTGYTGSDPGFIAKLNSSGSWDWTKTTANKGGRTIVKDKRTGYLYSAEQDSNGKAILCVYDADGALKQSTIIDQSLMIDHIVLAGSSVYTAGRMGNENYLQAYFVRK